MVPTQSPNNRNVRNNTNCNLVYGLPVTVIHSIYSSWISTVDLVSLDTAMCCFQRKTFVKVLGGYYGKCFTEGMHSKVLSGSYLRWLHLRNIIPLTINLRYTNKNTMDVNMPLEDIYNHYLHPNHPISSLNTEYSMSFESYIKNATSCGRTLNIERLNLSHSMCLDDEAIGGLVNSLQYIKQLDISYCANISDKAIQIIASAPWAANLQSFSASRCCKLSDVAVSAICLSSQDLQEVDFSWCSKLTDSAIVFITFYLKVCMSICMYV